VVSVRRNCLCRSGHEGVGVTGNRGLDGRGREAEVYFRGWFRGRRESSREMPLGGVRCELTCCAGHQRRSGCPGGEIEVLPYRGPGVSLVTLVLSRRANGPVAMV